MKCAAVLVLVLLTGCTFAQKHPGVTAGITAGTIGFIACAPAVEKVTTCLAIGAIAGLAIGGITGLVTTFADTSAHQLPPFEEEEPPIVRRKTRTEPPPGLVDAGVPEAPPVVDAMPPGDAAPLVDGAPPGEAAPIVAP